MAHKIILPKYSYFTELSVSFQYSAKAVPIPLQGIIILKSVFGTAR